jgi:hypothetical protein
LKSSVLLFCTQPNVWRTLISCPQPLQAVVVAVCGILTRCASVWRSSRSSLGC